MTETVEELRQALWDVYAALGCDTDGDPTPRSLVTPLGPLVLDAAKELAQSYWDALDLLPGASEATVREEGGWVRKRLVFDHTVAPFPRSTQFEPYALYRLDKP